MAGPIRLTATAQGLSSAVAAIQANEAPAGLELH